MHESSDLSGAHFLVGATIDNFRPQHNLGQKALGFGRVRMSPCVLFPDGLGHFPSWLTTNIDPAVFSLHQAILISRTLFAVVMGYLAYRLVIKPGQIQG